MLLVHLFCSGCRYFSTRRSVLLRNINGIFAQLAVSVIPYICKRSTLSFVKSYHLRKESHFLPFFIVAALFGLYPFKIVGFYTGRRVL